MDPRHRGGRRGGFRRWVAGRPELLEVAAHARLLGEDWRAVLQRPDDDVDAVVSDAVLQRAIELQEERDRNLARRLSNAINGARTIDGRGGGTSTA